MLERTSLERIVNRFKTSEICPSLDRWGYFTQDDISEVRTAGSKQQMISEVCERCRELEIDNEAIGELEILCVHLHSKQKTWSVHELTDSKEDRVTLNPAAVQAKLSRRLGDYFETDVSTKVVEKALWIRLCMYQGRDVKSKMAMTVSSDVVYIIHYPRTKFFLSSPIKSSFKTNVFKTVVSVLGYFSTRDMQLKGHCVKSLADIVLSRNSRGAYGEKTATGDKVNPLTQSRQQKRKDKEEELDERVTREGNRKRQKRMDALESAFGPFVQPSLEKIEFKLETQFRGFAQPHGQNRMDISRLERFYPMLNHKYQEMVEPKTFKCHVKFEGKNVLEGLRNLGQMGLVSVPLPKHLTSVSSQARNYFVLGDRTRPNRSQRSPAPA